MRLTATDRAALHEVAVFATDALRFATKSMGVGQNGIHVIRLALGLEILEQLVNSDDETTGDV